MEFSLKLQVFLGLAAIAAYAHAENCTLNSDCSSTHCVAGFHDICQHPTANGIVAGGGLCTCAVDNYACLIRADCLAVKMYCNSDKDRHCYDGKCVCNRWVYVSAEQCTVNTDCVTTDCANGYHKICQHPNPTDGIATNGGLCTCAANNYTCTNRDQCLVDTIIANLRCPSTGHIHCYDAKCICTRW